MASECVCWNKVLKECNAIKRHLYDKERGCKGCPFFKTEAEYFRQTGKTYAKEMKEAEYYHGNKY